MDTAIRVRAEITAATIGQLIGRAPMVTERPDGTAYLIFKQEDVPTVRQNLENLLFKPSATKPTVSLSLMPIVAPMALKRGFPAILGILAAGAVAGYLLRGK